MPIQDLTGQRFGRLTALHPTDQRSGTSVVWACRCDCGRTCAVSADALKRGATRSCGCLQDEARRDDITGQRRGQLTAVRPTDERKGALTVWEWRCDCGATIYKAAARVGAHKSTMCPACARRLKSAQAKAMADGEPRDEDTGVLASHLPGIREGKLFRTNTSGVRGVSWHAGRGKWCARIHENGKSRTLGYFSTIEEAAAARQAAVKKRYGAPDEDPQK